MKATFAPEVWLISGFLLLPCGVSPASSGAEANSQHDQLLLNGKQADVLLTKEPEQLKLTISAKITKGQPPDWSRVKATVYCFPGRQDLGGFRSEMTLVSTYMGSGKRVNAVFVFKAEPAVIDQVATVLVNAEPNACHFKFPLSREEVLARFRARASAEELRQVEQLRLAEDAADRERALELVLFKLTGGEWERIGIGVALTVPFFGQENWHVASGQYNEDTWNAIGEELGRAKISLTGVAHCGVMNWWAPKEQFFRARKVLLQARDPRVRACAVPPPRFQL